jgi:hypothetical protein
MKSSIHPYCIVKLFLLDKIHDNQVERCFLLGLETKLLHHKILLAALFHSRPHRCPLFFPQSSDSLWYHKSGFSSGNVVQETTFGPRDFMSRKKAAKPLDISRVLKKAPIG